ncbi:MAG: xanthine dehydrogenase family protein molybdopterin-binding subunit [Alphaproteobacteria bacterium]|nr:xanthine dehydrogenase family protein molybdopterin-binding subunit [Alphaproteobacteria bacterium]
MDGQSSGGIGARMRRLEDPRFLTGQGRYTDNIAARDALHVHFLRSPHAHARLRAVDTAAALAMPGVVAILTGRDVLADGLGHLPSIVEIKDRHGESHREPERLPISPECVRHVGEIVAMVVAERLDQARDAAEAIEVDYETLPAVVAADDALRPGAPQLHDGVPGNLMCDWARGDETAVADAFARAAHVCRLSQRFNRILGNYVEPRALFSEHDRASDVTTLVLASQGAHIPHRLLCDKVLKWPREKLHLVTPDVGGGFGPKFTLYPEAALLPWAARRLGRPLRWVCERVESFLSDNHARDLVAEIALALDEAGRFLAIKVEAAANFGAYVSMFAPSIPTNGMAKVLSGLYRIPAVSIAMRCAFTNTVPVDAFRGAGKPETLALLERLIDVAARETGRDPAELRRLNLVPPAAMPYRTALGYTYESGDYPRLLDEALRQGDRAGFADRRAASARYGRLRGFGIACHLHGSGGVADERSLVVVRGDGGIDAYTGTQSQGQGHETAFAQVVAEAFGVDYGKVRVRQGDTAKIARGGGTGGSSSTIISSTTLKLASITAIDRGRQLAAEFLEAAPADIAYADGSFGIVGTDRRIGLFEVAARAEADGRRLDGEAEFADKVESWSSGVMTCEVEVDPETGHVRVERLATTIDIGTVINPMLVEGQVHGGIAAGLGQALLEDAAYDRASGQILAASWMDYAMPRADDVPGIDVAMIATPSGNNALGIKGVGELPTNGAPAVVANALLDALAGHGVRHLETPATPERVWRALRGR